MTSYVLSLSTLLSMFLQIHTLLMFFDHTRYTHTTQHNTWLIQNRKILPLLCIVKAFPLKWKGKRFFLFSEKDKNKISKERISVTECQVETDRTYSLGMLLPFFFPLSAPTILPAGSLYPKYNSSTLYVTFNSLRFTPISAKHIITIKTTRTTKTLFTHSAKTVEQS